MKLYYILLVLLLTGCNLEDVSTSEIISIENGLTPTILIGGEPTWNILHRMDKHNVPGISLAVIFESELSWSNGYGIIKKGTDNRVDRHTLFQAASISKPVTAILTLRLVQEGILDLDSNVNEYLRTWKVPENEFTEVEKVTIRRILSHNAGLSVGGFRGYADEEQVPSLLQTLDGIAPCNSDSIRVVRIPGERYEYSGGGYIVLQKLLEDVTCNVISELMDSLLFDPLQMNNSILGDPYEKFSDEKISYAHNYKGDASKGYRFIDQGSACCELWTTAEDLAKLVLFVQQSLKGGHSELLRKDLAELLVTPYNNGSMALGFFSSSDGINTFFSHSGSNAPGFTCWLLAHASAGYGIVLMTNSQTGGPLYTEVLHSVANENNWSNFQPYSYVSFEDFLNDVRNTHNSKKPGRSFSENQINSIGYELLSMNRTKEAIQVLSLNTELYPESANSFDSLGDAYIEQGDTLNGFKAYRQAIHLIEQDTVKYHGNLYLISGYKKKYPGIFVVKQ